MVSTLRSMQKSAANGLPEHSTPAIYTTEDYGRFKFNNVNRPIDWGHVQALYDAIEEKNMLVDYPIVVTSEYEVLDGQHRLEAAKALGVPIYYIVSEFATIIDVAKANANTKNWNHYDYLNHFCEMGYPEYIKVRNYAEKYPFMSVRTVQEAMSAGSENVSKLFRGGQYKVTRPRFAEAYAQALLSMKPYVDFWDHTRFHAAMRSLMLNPHYEHDQMLKKMEYLSTKMVKCPDTSSYIEMINGIYNYNVLKKKRVNLGVVSPSEMVNRYD